MSPYARVTLQSGPMGFLTADCKHSYASRRVASVPIQIADHSKEDRDSTSVPARSASLSTGRCRFLPRVAVLPWPGSIRHVRCQQLARSLVENPVLFAAVETEGFECIDGLAQRELRIVRPQHYVIPAD